MDRPSTDLRLQEARRENYRRSRRACSVGDREFFDLLVWVTEQELSGPADRRVRPKAFFAGPPRFPQSATSPRRAARTR
jgi:hypothetical protein